MSFFHTPSFLVSLPVDYHFLCLLIPHVCSIEMTAIINALTVLLHTRFYYSVKITNIDALLIPEAIQTALVGKQSRHAARFTSIHTNL